MAIAKILLKLPSSFLKGCYNVLRSENGNLNPDEEIKFHSIMDKMKDLIYEMDEFTETLFSDSENKPS